MKKNEWDEIRGDASQASKLGMFLVTKWWILVIILTVLGSALTALLRPMWLGFERKAFVASHQYQESHNTALATMEEKKAELAVKMAETQNPDVRNALRAQMNAIQRRIDTEKRKLNQ